MNKGASMKWAAIGLMSLALALPRCSCGQGAAGAACDPNAETPCTEGLVCLERGDDGHLCLIPVGESCEPDAEDPYCEPAAICEPEREDEGVCRMGDGGRCDPEAEPGHCAGDRVCEAVTGSPGSYACWAATVLEGRVLDATSRDGIEGAHVIALDAQRTPVTDVAVSESDGSYALQVPVPRDSSGKPAGVAYTMRASAADYQTFPGGLRSAIPIDVDEATARGEGFVISSSLTEILLVPLPVGERGLPSVSGQVEAEGRDGGVLVVAEGGPRGFSALSDRSGDYEIFNVPAGSYTVRGYRAGVQLQPVEITVASEDLTDINLEASSTELSRVSGNLQIVNAPGGLATSVVLVVQSTFDETFVRGEVPPGLRTPREGPPDVSGGWEITDVPDGTYVVLAAFENDELVRDPDTNIAGTQIVTIAVPDPADGRDVNVDDSFKITEALPVIGPGRDAPEAVSDPPTLRWEDDSSESLYEVVVYNAYGDLVWELQMPGVSGGDVEVVFGGPALESGMYYQFRATSLRDPGGNVSPISTTEDLRGVFYLAE